MNKIGTYYKDARERTKRRKSPWNWLLLPFFIFGLGSTGFFMAKGLLDIQHLLIPSDAILSGETTAGRILMFLPILPLSCTLGAMVANFIVWCIPPARRVLDKESKGIKGASFKAVMKLFSTLTIILLIISAPLCLLGTFNYFYVTPSGVTLNPLFSLKEKHYEWGDIVRIHAECLAESNNLHLNYILHMKDGARVDLLNETRLKFVYAYGKIKPFIRAQKHIVYDYKMGSGDIEGLRRFYPEQDAEKFIKIIRNEE